MSTAASEAIRAYMETVNQPRKRGRRPAGVDELRAKLEDVDAKLRDARALERVHLFQQKLDIEERIRDRQNPSASREAVEAAFVEHIAEWAASKGVTFQALRAAGVPAAVLRKAGMTP